MSSDPDVLTLSKVQYEGMVAGKPYHYSDPYVQVMAKRGMSAVASINAERDGDKRTAILKDFFTKTGPEGDFYVALPFFCEYGHIDVGDSVYIGPNCTFLDVAPVKIGNRTLIGPSCSIYTPGHPISPEARNGTKGPEWATAIEIGEDCWLGGSVIVLGGVKIGNGVTVGAGSVVTKDVPDRVVVVGNPARIVKHIPLPGA